MQLRERTASPRGIWRQGRGRGRGFPGPPQVDRGVPFGAALAFNDGNFRATSSPVVSEYRITTPVTSPGTVENRSPWNERPFDSVHDLTDDSLRGRKLQGVASGSTSSVSSSTTKVPSLRYEISHQAPSTIASSTPPPSSSSVSTTTSALGPAAPYPMNVGYFPPQPWVQPYAPPYPYAVPMIPNYGYAGYSYPSMQPMAPTFYAREPTLDATNNISSSMGSITTGDSTYKVRSGENMRLSMN